jgi:hypothetical protein
MNKFMSKAKALCLAIVTIAVGLSVSSCTSKDDLQSVNTRAITSVITVSGVISSNTTWTSDNEYDLDGKVYVSSGATLTIQPGTVIKGLAADSTIHASALIITRGSKIDAQGTATNPIVMTAANGTKGGWGGLVLLGNAQINQTPNQLIEGIDPTKITIPTGVDVYYGSNDAANNTESSGTLKYVRVEYAGASIAAANELNAFTFGGVGSGTTLEHLQAYKGADDAFEFFGGCVNAKYLIATANDDDSFDFDFGYTGKLQFLVATIDASMSYSSDPNGIECDNDKQSDGTGSNNTPYTHPYISNLTFVGTVDGKVTGGGVVSGSDHLLKSCADFRRNCQYTLVNSILYGAKTGILDETSNSYVLENNVVVASPAGTGVNFSGVDVVSTTNYGLTDYSAITLTSPWGNAYAHTTEALTPTGGYADSGVYDAASISSFFVNTDWKGGALDDAAVYWLGDSWIKKD